jgi:alpha-glucosidase (family GH31 glycosyl hydrolase)
MSRPVPLLLAFAIAGCGGESGRSIEVTDGTITVVVDEVPARIQVLRAGVLVWETTPGARSEGGAPPLGFAGVGAGEPTVEMMFGSYRFTDRSPTWVGIRRLRELVAGADGRSATFTLDGEGTGAARITETGHVEITLTATAASRVSLASTCRAGEHFVGLGGQSWDVDHRGQTVRLWVQEDGIGKTDLADDDYSGLWFVTGRRHSTHTPMPIVLSSSGYGVIVDTDARATFALCSESDEVARFEAWSPALAVHVFAGDQGDVRDVLAQMTAWTGRPAVPPAFAFAPWIDAIFGEDNVRRVAQRLRAEGVPAAVVWTEDWRGGSASGDDYALDEDWRVDRTLYPNIETLAGDLHGLGFKFLTYNNTFVDETADIFAEAVAGGYVVEDATGAPYLFDGVRLSSKSALLDLTSPEARTWARAIFQDGLALGSDGWMADFGEWLPADAVVASGADALGVAHNRYPVEWAQLNHELLAAQGDGVERLTFARAAWLHAQPFVQILWTGDQQTDFSDGDGLPSVIPMMIGLGVTGFPYTGSDIAGYMSALTMPTDQELWYRWVTLGALSPVMRTHHGRSALVGYQWEADAGSVAHFRRWARLHMQLVPYLQGLARTAEATGLPLVRLTALEFPGDDRAWTLTDQYMLGDRILVAPVVRQGATERTVHVPPGTWYPLLGGAAVAGAQDVAIAAPIAELPALVPEGTLLVLYPDGVDTVLDAPAAPTAVTAAEIGDDREAWLWRGTGAHGAWMEPGGRAWAWTGRDPALPAPAAATWNGAPVPVDATSGEPVVIVDGDGTLVYEGGGELTITGGAAQARTTVRLR